MACPCAVCRNARWVAEWVEGRKVPRPDDETLKSEVNRLITDLKLAQDRATEGAVRVAALQHQLRFPKRVEYDGHDDLH